MSSSTVGRASRAGVHRRWLRKRPPRCSRCQRSGPVGRRLPTGRLRPRARTPQLADHPIQVETLAAPVGREGVGIEQKRGGWRSPRQAADWLRSLERHVFPGIGSRPVSDVNSADVLAVLTPLWHVKMQTARTLRERIRAVLEWAIAMEYRVDNPCDRVLPVLGPQREVVRHMRALPHREVAAALEAVRAARSTRAVKLAFEFLVLTAPPR